MSPENEKALADAALTDRRIDPELQRSLAAHVRRLVARVEELEAELADREEKTVAVEGPGVAWDSISSFAQWYTVDAVREKVRRAAELLARKEGK